MDSILQRLEMVLGPRESTPVPIPGGITNRNYQVRFGGADYVLRISSADPHLLGIDRDAEVAANQSGEVAGVAPGVVVHLPEERCTVIDFVESRKLEPEEVSGHIPALATVLRKIHAAPAIEHCFSPFRIGERYVATARERGGEIPAITGECARLAAEVERRLGPFEASLCHNDLLASNILVDDHRMWVIDWEYAGMGDPAFDLGNVSVNNDFTVDDDLALVRAYAGRDDERLLARLRLMRVASDWREGTWGVVQTVLSELDFDYASYGREHLERMLTSDWQEWLGGTTA